MALIRFVVRTAGHWTVALALLAALGSAVNAGLIAVVHRALQDPHPSLFYAFVGLGLARVGSTFVSALLANRYWLATVNDLRLQMVELLLGVRYRTFERIGRERVYATLTQDLATVAGILRTLPSLLLNLAMLAGAAAYLAYLSPAAIVVMVLPSSA